MGKVEVEIHLVQSLSSSDGLVEIDPRVASGNSDLLAVREFVFLFTQEDYGGIAPKYSRWIDQGQPQAVDMKVVFSFPTTTYDGYNSELQQNA